MIESVFYVIQKRNERFVSKDGRSCKVVERAKQFGSAKDAIAFLNQPIEKLGCACYISPQEFESGEYKQWNVIHVRRSYTLTKI